MLFCVICADSMLGIHTVFCLDLAIFDLDLLEHTLGSPLSLIS